MQKLVLICFETLTFYFHIRFYRFNVSFLKRLHFTVSTVYRIHNLVRTCLARTKR